jgi:hypothetical protein
MFTTGDTKKAQGSRRNVKLFYTPYLDSGYYLEAVQQHKPLKRHPMGDKATVQFGFAVPLNSDWFRGWMSFLTQIMQ